MDYVYTHVSHIDLVDIGHNVSATARPMASCNPIPTMQSYVYPVQVEVDISIPKCPFGPYNKQTPWTIRSSAY